MCGVAGVMMGLTALNGYSQYRQQQAAYESQAQAYEAQAKSYEAQALAAQQNQKIAEAQRSQVADNYAEKQKTLDARRRLALGQQAAAAGASGLMSTGSVLDVASSTQDAWKQDSLNLLQNQRNDAMSAWINQVNYINQENQAKAYGNQAREAASNTRAQAKQAKLASLVNTAVSMWGVSKNYGNTGVNTNTNNNSYSWYKLTNQYKNHKNWR